jgi:hypothetical protein
MLKGRQGASMLEGIPIALANVGPWGLLILLVAFLIVAFVKGWIAPKYIVDTWVEAYKTERAARNQQDAVLAEMAEGMRLSVDMLKSIKATSERRRTGDDS